MIAEDRVLSPSRPRYFPFAFAFIKFSFVSHLPRVYFIYFLFVLNYQKMDEDRRKELLSKIDGCLEKLISDEVNLFFVKCSKLALKSLIFKKFFCLGYNFRDHCSRGGTKS